MPADINAWQRVSTAVDEFFPRARIVGKEAAVTRLRAELDENFPTQSTEQRLDAALLAFLAAENLAVIPGITRERAEEYARQEMEQGAERIREALRAALLAAL